MKSPFYFIVKPIKGRRYDNIKKIGGLDIVTSVSKEDYKSSNRFAEVIALPINYTGDIEVGNVLLVHHNVFKYYNDMNESSSVQGDEKAAEVRLSTENELKQEFGSQYGKRLDQAKRLASSTLGNEFLENTYLQDGSKLGDNVAIVKAFSNLAEKLSEDEVVKGDSSYSTAKDLQKEIASLTEEGSSYWSKQHPNHDKTVSEVFKLRQLLNNGE